MRGIKIQIFTKIGKNYQNDQICCHKMTYRYQNIQVKEKIFIPLESRHPYVDFHPKKIGAEKFFSMEKNFFSLCKHRYGITYNIYISFTDHYTIN